MKIYFTFILLLSTFWICNITAQSSKTSTEIKFEKMGLVDIQKLEPKIRVDLKYATTDNFTKVKLYDSIQHAYLQPLAAKKLVKAHQLLKEKHPELFLLIYDAVRPISVQKKMYEQVKDTKYRAYVANPANTGLHNYGMAVDLTICNEKGEALDMGTSFDYFGRAAGINKENELIQEKILSKKQVENRKILRTIMVEAGFLTIRGEWWHFNAVSLSTAKSLYSIIK